MTFVFTCCVLKEKIFLFKDFETSSIVEVRSDEISKCSFRVQLFKEKLKSNLSNIIIRFFFRFISFFHQIY